MQVKLEQIMEAMEMQPEESHSYLNLETGEVVNVSDEALWIAEDGENYDHLPEWQQDEVKIAYDIAERFDRYSPLPTRFDINEYDMIEGFCYSLSDHTKQDVLLNSIKGKGAFRRFKDNVNQLGISHQWYNYRDNRYREIAMGFCGSKNIEYVE
jgi:hypothetical protein